MYCVCVCASQKEVKVLAHVEDLLASSVDMYHDIKSRKQDSRIGLRWKEITGDSTHHTKHPPSPPTDV